MDDPVFKREELGNQNQVLDIPRVQNQLESNRAHCNKPADWNAGDCKER